MQAEAQWVAIYEFESCLIPCHTMIESLPGYGIHVVNIDTSACYVQNLLAATP